MIERQGKSEDDGERQAHVAQHHEASREGPAVEVMEGEDDIDHMHARAQPDQRGGARQRRPRSDPEVRDHTDHADQQYAELPARQPFAPERPLEDDGDQLVRSAEDAHGDPAEGYRVGQGKHARVIVVPAQLRREPR